MQRNDCRRWMQIRNKGTWKVMQQTTWHQKRDRDELGSRECDKLGLQSLSGGFRLVTRLHFRNQNLIDRPNIMQPQYDSTIIPRGKKVNTSTTNPRKENIRNKVANELKNATIAVSNFTPTVPMEPNPKNEFLVIVLGLL